MENTEIKPVLDQLNQLMLKMAKTQELPYPHPEFDTGYVYETKDIHRFVIENNQLLYQRYQAEWDDDNNITGDLIEEQRFSSLNGLAYFYWKDSMYFQSARVGREKVKQKYAAKFPNTKWCSTLWINETPIKDVPCLLLLPEKKQDLIEKREVFFLELLHFEFSEREFKKVITYHNRCNKIIDKIFAEKISELDNIIFQAGLNKMLGLPDVPALQNPLSQQLPENKLKNLNHAREWKTFRQYVKRHFLSVSGIAIERWTMRILGVIALISSMMLQKISMVTHITLSLVLILYCLRPLTALAKREFNQLHEKRASPFKKLLNNLKKSPQSWFNSRLLGWVSVILWFVYLGMGYLFNHWNNKMMFACFAVVAAYIVVQEKEAT